MSALNLARVMRKSSADFAPFSRHRRLGRRDLKHLKRRHYRRSAARAHLYFAPSTATGFSRWCRHTPGCRDRKISASLLDLDVADQRRHHRLVDAAGARLFDASLASRAKTIGGVMRLPVAENQGVECADPGVLIL